MCKALKLSFDRYSAAALSITGISNPAEGIREIIPEISRYGSELRRHRQTAKKQSSLEFNEKSSSGPTNNTAFQHNEPLKVRPRCV